MGKAKAWLAATAAAGIIILGGATNGTVRSAWAMEAGGESPAAVAAVGMAIVPYKALTWDDFRVDDSASGMAAETGTALGFRYQMHPEKAANASYTVTVSSITFTGGFDRMHSWRRSKTISHPDAARLLAHEQGHFDIAELGRRHLESLPLSVLPEGHGPTINDAVEDLKARMAVWFRGESSRIKIRQLQYDMETEFSTKKQTQQAWNALLTREISQPAAAAPLLASLSTPVPSQPQPGQ